MTAIDFDRRRLLAAELKRARKRMRGREKHKVRLGDRCPACGHASVVEITVLDEQGPIDGCVNAECKAIWEREVRKHPELERCASCAFRPGSDEQRDPEVWREIIDKTVKARGEFWCHKRVPFVITPSGYEYQHAKDERGRPTQTPRCHGWLTARVTKLLAEHKAEVAHAG